MSDFPRRTTEDEAGCQLGVFSFLRLSAAVLFRTRSAVMACEFYLAVASCCRPDSTQPLHAALGAAASQVQWWVPEGQHDEYKGLSKGQGARLAPKLGSTSRAYALRGNGAMDRGKALQKSAIILADYASHVTSVQQQQCSWGQHLLCICFEGQWCSGSWESTAEVPDHFGGLCVPRHIGPTTIVLLEILYSGALTHDQTPQRLQYSPNPT